MVKLIVSDDAELTEVSYKCTADGTTFTAVEEGGNRQTKHNCGSNLSITGEKDVIEELIGMTDNLGVDTVFVSANSQYGKELLMGFHGLAAMLKYKQ